MDKNILFFDLETSGLDPARHCILQFGSLECTPDLAIVGTKSIKVLPRPGAILDQKALEVNGYRPEDWTTALKWQDAIREIYLICKGRTLAGHNVIDFDWPFLASVFVQANRELVMLERDWLEASEGMIDTLQIAKNRGLKSKVGGSLNRLLVEFGVVSEGWTRGVHEAVEDCRLTRELFMAMKARGVA